MKQPKAIRTATKSRLELLNGYLRYRFGIPSGERLDGMVHDIEDIAVESEHLLAFQV